MDWFLEKFPKMREFVPFRDGVQAIQENSDQISGIDKGLLKELGLRLIAAGISLSITALLIRWIIKNADPTSNQREAAKKRAQLIFKQLKIDEKKANFTPHEMDIAAQLICNQQSGVGWEDVGGCEDLIRQLQDSLILPLRLNSNSILLEPPKGVLLYGPPGCGKTLLAKAIARAAGAYFINLQVSSLTDKWYGESQKLAAAVFSLYTKGHIHVPVAHTYRNTCFQASKLNPAIIFIDEVDSFLRSRSSHDHEATAMMKAQFMSLWDGFASSTGKRSRIVIMGATNRPNDVDNAILRRMPCRFHVKMPNLYQRESILKVILQNEVLEDGVGLEQVAAVTKNMSGSDLREVCRLAVVHKTRDLIEEGIEITSEEASQRGLSLEQLVAAAKQFKATTLATVTFSDRQVTDDDMPVD